MSPDQARRTAAHARRLLTAHILNTYDFAVLDAMLWRLRRPGRFDLAVDYKSIARLAGVCRDTAIKCVRKLEDIGVIGKFKRRIRVRWGRGRECVASRQIANAYVFRVPQTESAGSATDRGLTSPSTLRQHGPPKKTPLDKAMERLAASAGLTVPS